MKNKAKIQTKMSEDQMKKTKQTNKQTKSERTNKNIASKHEWRKWTTNKRAKVREGQKEKTNYKNRN